jgi:hypothetical protein
MALKLKPPTHRADVFGVFISRHDTAWDNPLINAEIEVLQAKALAEAQARAAAVYSARHPGATAEETQAAAARCELTDAQNAEAIRRHPAARYMMGTTRYQLNAPDWRPDGKPCTARDYLKPGAAEFTICRLKPEAYHLADAIENSGLRLTAFARAGLRAVRSSDWAWEAGDRETSVEDVLRALHDADVTLPLEIGEAVIAMRRPLDEAETFP